MLSVSQIRICCKFARKFDKHKTTSNNAVKLAKFHFCFLLDFLVFDGKWTVQFVKRKKCKTRKKFSAL